MSFIKCFCVETIIAAVNIASWGIKAVFPWERHSDVVIQKNLQPVTKWSSFSCDVYVYVGKQREKEAHSVL